MRIASLSPAATEIVYALGRGEDIVCVDQFSNVPDEAKGIPHLRGHQKIDEAVVREYTPDLVLTGTVIQTKLADDLRKEGCTVVHQDPRTLFDIYESIRQLGAILSAEEEANQIVLKMQQGFNAVKKKANLLPVKPKVYIEEWHQPPMASGNWVPEVMKVAGCVPFPISSGELSREVTLAEVQRFDPDLIVISWCGAGLLADKKILLNRTDWNTLRAVREGKVKVIDDSLLNRPGPRLVEGAQHLYGWLFEMLH